MSRTLPSIREFASGANKYYAAKLLSLALVCIGLSIVATAYPVLGQGIADALPESLAFAAWFIPPLFRVIDLLGRDAALSFSDAAGVFLGTLTYAGALIGVFWVGVNKRGLGA